MATFLPDKVQSPRLCTENILMKKILFFGLLLFLCSNSLFAQFKTTNQSGEWENPEIWTPSGVPSGTDEVVVNHEVSVESSLTIEVTSLRIENISNTEPAYLRLNSGADFLIGKDLNVVSADFNSIAGMEISLGSSMLVDGNAFISRLATNNSASGTFNIRLLSNGILNVMGSFHVQYEGSSMNESTVEFELGGGANLISNGPFNKTVSGDGNFQWLQTGVSLFDCRQTYTCTYQLGNSLSFDVSFQSTFKVSGTASFFNYRTQPSQVVFSCKGLADFGQNLIVNSLSNSGGFLFEFDNPNAQLRIAGNVNIDAGAPDNVELFLSNWAKLYLGGNITRIGGFGNLIMSSNARFVYTGGGIQTLVDPIGEGTDAFTPTNIDIEIPEGDSIVLQKDFEIKWNLNLKSGIIISKNNAKLIVGDGANITGGSPTAYIEGPVQKINITSDSPFTFPLGHQGVYAPLTLETVGSRSAGGLYEAKYLNCPPPWPGTQAVNIEQLSSQEFWELRRTESSEDVNVRLHWTDATAQGITDTEDLVVAMYNPDPIQFPTFPAGWTSIGQEGLVGGVGNGVSGSIQNIGTCPPPWGIELFTFASTSNSNSLPVEMELFEAKILTEVVELTFETVNEINVESFVVEKSNDGVNFTPFELVTPKGGEGQIYNLKDLDPQVGLNYYRIKKVDQDGMYAYTAIRSVDFKSTSEILAFPNPASDQIILKGKWLNSANELVIYDSNGLLIYREKLIGQKHSIQYELESLNIYKSGIYVLEVRAGSRMEQIKLVKP